jgi:hypothetical protein
MTPEHKARVKGILKEIEAHKAWAASETARLRGHVETVSLRRTELERQRAALDAARPQIYDDPEPDRLSLLLADGPRAFTKPEDAKRRAARHEEINHTVIQLTRDIELLDAEERKAAAELEQIVFDRPADRARLLGALAEGLLDAHERASWAFAEEVMLPLLAIRNLVDQFSRYYPHYKGPSALRIGGTLDLATISIWYENRSWQVWPLVSDRLPGVGRKPTTIIDLEATIARVIDDCAAVKG